LTTTDAIYSFGKKYHAFNAAFSKLDLQNKKVKEVLVLGGGLGSVCEILRSDFNQSANYTLVEYDQAIIRMAERTLDPRTASQCTFHHQDAQAFTESCAAKYDLLIVDIFKNLKVPSTFLKPDFISNLKPLLNLGGHLLFNFIVTTPNAEKIAFDYFDLVFKPCFPEAKKLLGDGNLILWAKEGAKASA